MTTKDFISLLTDVLQYGELSDSFVDICSFAEGGVMTKNKGLVVQMDDDSEFQITIVQSGSAADGSDDID